jgi:putative thioredoxin
VKAFKGGQLVSEFTGAIPEESIRQFLRALVPSRAEIAAEGVRHALAQGRVQDAKIAMQAIADEDKKHPLVVLVRAEVAMAENDAATAANLLDEFMAPAGHEDRANCLLANVRMAQLAASDDESSLRQRVDQSPSGNDLLALAAHEARGQHLSVAFTRGLDVLTTHRKTHKDQAQQFLLALIQLEPDDANRRGMRRRLSTALF